MAQPQSRGGTGVPSRRLRTGGAALRCVLIVGLFVGLAGAPARAATPEDVGEWGAVQTWPTFGKHLVLLPTGKVLAFSTGANAHVWDPSSGGFKPVPATFGDLHCAGHATLADGSPIVVGGTAVSWPQGIKVNATFDPVTETWTDRQPMQHARWYPTATTLGDGRVLATSGTDETGTVWSTTPEVYDPATDKWSALTGAVKKQPYYPFMYQLANGKVFDAGPASATGSLDVAGTGSWTAGPVSGWKSSGAEESGAMYGHGKILKSGGGDPARALTGAVDMSASLPQWDTTAPMAFPRRRHNLVVLADGSILAVGGTRQADDPAQAVLESELWNPETKTWRTVDALSLPRMYHSAALLLPDGRVVASGGDRNLSGSAKTTQLSAEVYSPPYLFKGARPQVTSAPSQASFGSTFTVGTDAADVESVALIRPGAVTHAIDMNQRYVPLNFTRSGDDLTVTAPANGNAAPPGAYMLVVKNSAGVPSVARWVVLGEGAAPPPSTLSARFSMTPLSGVAPLQVQFTDGSTGSPTSWAWDFDDDGSVDSTSQNPSHTYTAPGRYTVRLTVSDGEGTHTVVKEGAIDVTETAPVGDARTYVPTGDAMVRTSDTSPDAAGTNYGARTYLQVRQRTDTAPNTYRSFLKFDVSGLSARVDSAKLRLHTYSQPPALSGVTTLFASKDAGTVFRVPSDWTETGSTGITWNSAPPLDGEPVAAVGPAPLGTWIEVDVTSAVTGNGPVSFGIKEGSTTSTFFSSRDGAHPPELVVTQTDEPPPVTAEFSAAPTEGTAPLDVDFYDFSAGSPTTFAWDFDNDGTVDSTAQTPAHTYTTPGTYTVKLEVSGPTGSDTQTRTGLIKVAAPDTTAPVTHISSGPSGPTDSTTASFSFEAGDSVEEKVECSLDGGAWIHCHSPLTLRDLAQGEHRFAVRGTDEAGNTTKEPATREWVVDTVAPEAGITSAPAAATNDTSAVFSLDIRGATTAECSLDGAAWSPCASTDAQRYADLADGAHTFAVRGRDAAGNVTPTPARHDWTVDTVAPDTEVYGGAPDGWAPLSGVVTFFFSTVPAEPASFECSLDDGPYRPCSGPGPLESLSSLGAGDHTLSVRGVDAAGNRDGSPSRRAWTVSGAPAAGAAIVSSTPARGAAPVGAVATLDADNDGYQRRPEGADCDDRNPAAHPNARETRGNGIDEDCDGVAAPWPVVASGVRADWRVSGGATSVLRMHLLDVSAGARVTVECAGSRTVCPVKSARMTVARAGSAVSIRRLLGAARLRRGATLEVRVDGADRRSIAATFTVRAGKSPSRRFRCFEPRTGRPTGC